MAATILTITDLAARLETEPRTARKFLRTITPKDDQPGKGSRWAIEAKQVQSLKSKFKKYTAEVNEAKAAKVADSIIEVDGVEVAEVMHSDITD